MGIELTALGNIVDMVGTALGLPDAGYSENIAGGATINSYKPGNILGPSTEAVVKNNVVQDQPNTSGVKVITSSGQTPITGGGGTSGGGSGTSGAAADWAKYHAGEGNMPVGYGGEGGGGTSAPSANYDELYAPYFSALDASKQSAQDNAQLASNDIDTGAAGQLRSIDTEIGNSNTAYQTTTDRATENKNNALQDAIRSYLSMSQQGNARFGRGSSAGAAVGELAQQEYFRNQGKIEVSGNETLADISSKWVASLKAYSNAKLDLNDKVATMKSQNQQNLNSVLGQINTQVSLGQQQKSQQRLDALKEATSYNQQILAMKTQAETNLNSWISQMEYTVSHGLQQTYSTQPSSQVATGTYSAMGNTNPVASQGLNIRFNPNTGKYEDDKGNQVNF